MTQLAAQFRAYAERVDALSLRERGLIFFAVVIVLYLIAHNVVFAPLRAEQHRLEQELQSKREQIQTTDRQVTALLGGGAEASAAHRARIAALQAQIAELNRQMDRETAGLVSPKEMARLVEQVLSRTKGLQLVKLEALPPQAIDAAGAPAQSESGDVTIYRHGMRVEFKGRYIEIVEYLKALESLPWKVFWGEVALESEDYPISHVSLVVYTLSRHAGWIGV